MIRKFTVIFAIFACLSLQAASAGQFKIAATVGPDIVTTYDLFNRARLIVFSSGLPTDEQTFKKVAPQALQSLVNDKIIMQEADRLSITIAEEEIIAAFKNVEQRNKMPDGVLESTLKQNGIPAETLKDQLKSQIAFSRIKGMRVRPQVNISNDEVEDFVRAQSFNQEVEEYLVNEIVLPVESSKDEASVKQLADKLYAEIQSGKDFGAIARQFSGSGSALNDGVVGWLPENQLPKEILAELKKNEVGVASAPIKSIEGYFIVKAAEKRKQNSLALEDEINVKSFEIAFGANADAKKIGSIAQKLSKISYDDEACNNPEGFAINNGINYRDYGQVKIADLEPKIAALVADLDLATFSPVIKTPSSALSFLICERIQNIAPLIDDKKRNQARDALFERKMELQSRKYMRDLRRKTNIEIKV